MSSLQRRVGMLILIALLLLLPNMLLAQDGGVTVVGSGIPAPLIQAFASAAGVDATVNVNGTNDGFAVFCGGQAAITTATRAISAAEENDCSENGVNFLEFVLGYDIMVVVANPATDFGQCLTTDQLNALFAPSATATNWNQVTVGGSDTPLTLVVPPDNTSPFALLDSLVEGVGLRDDVTKVADDAAVISTVSSTPGSLGAVSLTDAQAAGASVSILQLNTTTGGCTDATPEAVDGRSYTGAYRLFAYANSAQIDAVRPLFEAAFSADSAATVAARGLVAASPNTLATDAQILAETLTGRQFSKDVTAFSIPANLVGTINIADSAAGGDYMTGVTGAFVQQYAGVTLNQTINGQPDALRKLCNGEADIITTFSDLDTDTQANCAANNIPIETFNLGSQAVVIVGNGDFLACLTTDQLNTVWNATSEKTITNWNQVDAGFSDLPITLVAPPVGDVYADLLMLRLTGQSFPTREDFAEAKGDPAYRVTAVGNVPGGMTYVNWQAYQRLTPEVQARAQVVGVDAGNGCVTPSNDTIADATYPIARPLLLTANRLSMARQEVQSLLWYMFSDQSYGMLSSNGFIGLDFTALPDLRDRLQRAFAQAQNDALEAIRRGTEATPEATGEAPSDATDELTIEQIPEAATAEPTEETVPAPTEATAEPTVEATAEATAAS
jgi:phosphate transport system substrate-binding protein